MTREARQNALRRLQLERSELQVTARLKFVELSTGEQNTFWFAVSIPAFLNSTFPLNCR
jgi:hypothetical protein